MVENPRKLYTYLKNNFRIKKTTNGWWSFNCPFCDGGEEKMKMAANFDYQYVKCWVCSYRNGFVDFVSDFEGINYIDAKQRIRGCEASNIDLEHVQSSSVVKTELSALSLPYGYNSILDGSGMLGNRARNYLKGRGFSLKELDRMGVGYCNESCEEEDKNFFGYIIIPFRSASKLVYYIGRDYIGNFLRYKNPPKEGVGIGKGELLFNEDALQIYGQVYITEGWADALTMGRKGVSTQGWSLSQTQKLKIMKSPTEELVMIPDAGVDNTGITFYKKAVKLAIDFLEYKKVKVLDLNGLDEHKKDANELGKETILGIEKSTDFLNFGTAIEILSE